jgi:hypothetical protein
LFKELAALLDAARRAAWRAVQVTILVNSGLGRDSI